MYSASLFVGCSFLVAASDHNSNLNVHHFTHNRGNCSLLQQNNGQKLETICIVEIRDSGRAQGGNQSTQFFSAF